MKKLIELDNLTKEFNGQVVLKGIHLDIHENEFMTLLGPSGCGKTTTLRIVGGFEEASSGEVLFDGMIFQHCHLIKERSIQSFKNMLCFHI